MFHIVLFQPEIPPNTGNIIRLCANTGCQLHLIKPLGFHFTDAQLKRAGLDYHEYASVKIHTNFLEFQQAINPTRLFACSTKGQSIYSNISYQPKDAFVFGPETRGLPASILQLFDKEDIIKIPMKTPSRSLNLANAVSIIIYEAWRQLGFNDLI